MAYRISLTSRNAGVDGILALYNKGGNPSNSFCRIFGTTTQPSTPETAPGGSSVILADIPFSSTAFSASAGGTGVATGLPLESTVLNSGTAAWFRFYTGASTPAALSDGTITTTAVGTGDMLFDNTTFVSGGIVRLTALSFTIPM